MVLLAYNWYDSSTLIWLLMEIEWFHFANKRIFCAERRNLENFRERKAVGKTCEYSNFLPKIWPAYRWICLGNTWLHTWIRVNDVRGFFLFGGVRFWYGCPIRRAIGNAVEMIQIEYIFDESYKYKSNTKTIIIIIIIVIERKPTNEQTK